MTFYLNGKLPINIMDALNEIEQALKSTSERAGPTSADYFETYWKPKFDAVRASMVSPELKKAMYDLVFEMMDHEPWDKPFDQLRTPASGSP